MLKRLAILPLFLFLFAAGMPDEGMWPFHDLPLKQLKERYGFEADQAWYDHLRLASVKVSSGGSGSFISPTGLVATNHHVGLDFINALSTPDRDLVEHGFLANSSDEELRCPGGKLHQLVEMEDVSARITKTGVERQAQITALEKGESARTGLDCQVVAMHGGARHFLYRYKVYDDLRLVFAPEKQLGYFGGDSDNFCYPRFCLDVCLLRAYENGKPASTPDYLEWSRAGVAEHDLVFISGNPARTGRYETMGQLRFKRDVRVPAVLKLIVDREQALVSYSDLGAEQRIEVLDTIFSLRNSLKFYRGNMRSFVDPAIWGTLQRNESEFRRRTADQPEVVAAFETIEEGRRRLGPMTKETGFMRLDGPLAQFASQLEHALDQLSRPEDQRAAAFKGESFERMKGVLVGQKINVELSWRMLAASLETSRAVLGETHPFVTRALGDLKAEEAARAMVDGTRLLDADFRARLLAGELPESEIAGEPLLALARMKREANETYGPEMARIEEAEEKALKVIARARFALMGDTIYPDATFTLRLSYGEVKGYELGTTDVPWKTNVWGLFGRNSSFDNMAPYELPQRWLDAREKLDLDTPVDFVCTADTTGGNSGSPVVNRKGEIVGLLFDGNIESLLTDNLYEEVVCRSVCVDVRFIAEALDKVYGAERLLVELGLKR
ncbi:MAG: S46 family peptidase [Planctomycetes bacterium]|nr:S46 family peptidase [Planctomycetota bacterium]